MFEQAISVHLLLTATQALSQMSMTIWFSLSSSSTSPALTRVRLAISFAFLEPPDEALLTLRNGFRALASFFSGDPSWMFSAFRAERVRLRPGVSPGLSEEMDDFVSSVTGDTWSLSCEPRIVERKLRAIDEVSQDAADRREWLDSIRFMGEDPSFLPLTFADGHAGLPWTTMLESSTEVQLGKYVQPVCILTSEDPREALYSPML